MHFVLMPVHIEHPAQPWSRPPTLFRPTHCTQALPLVVFEDELLATLNELLLVTPVLVQSLEGVEAPAAAAPGPVQHIYQVGWKGRICCVCKYDLISHHALSKRLMAPL